MKTKYTLTLAAIAGFGLGAAAIESLHAQAKPPVGRILAGGGKVTPIEGAPPKPRVAVQMWDSVEKIQAWRNSKEYKENRKIGDKYAKFRSYAVEGVSQ